MICHLTTVHARNDVRIYLKECMGLARLGFGPIKLIVADGLGSKDDGRVAVVDIGKARFGRLGRVFLGSWGVWRAVRRIRPDAVHLHDPELLMVGILLRQSGLVVIYDMHECLPKQVLTKEWLHRSVRRSVSLLVGSIERAMLRNMPVVFAESSYMLDYPWIHNFEVVRNLPDLKSLSEVNTSEIVGFTIGYMGGVTVQRGVLVALKAMHELRGRGLKVEFECVGPVSEEVFRSDLFQRAKAEGWARFPGRLPPRRGWELMAGCVCGLAILAPSPNYVDSLPTKIFEYMALSRPVIASDFPLYRSVVLGAECGLVVDPLSVDAVAKAISWIAEHKEEASLMGRRGAAVVVEKYSWEVEAKRLGDFYRRNGVRASAPG